MESKVCPRCRTEKPISEFGRRKGRKSQFYCKQCHTAYNSEWYKKNRERNLKYHLGVTRRTSLHTSGGFVTGLNKRKYTGYCEICGVRREKCLHYHHWDESNLSKGIWICAWCHKLVTMFESGLIEQRLPRYLRLKEMWDES